MNVVSKVLTAILNKRLYTWAEKEGKISKEQAGFRKHYSTTDHIFTLTSIIKRELYSRKRSKVYAAFIHYNKAFDTVDRDKVWETLLNLETSSKAVKMIRAMYSCVQCCVRWGAKLSEVFECHLGVKQGCLLSPLIFSLLMSEVANFIRKKWETWYSINSRTRRNISVIIRRRHCVTLLYPHRPPNQINSLEKASSSLGLVVYLEKTKVMVFSKGGHIAATEKWFYHQTEIEIVNSYKYPGYNNQIIFSCRLYGV